MLHKTQFRNNIPVLVVAGLSLIVIPTRGQTTNSPWPWASASPASAPAPSREIPLTEKTWEELSNHDTGTLGKMALDMDSTKWKHAETDHFIVHFRRLTEAHKVVREIEYDLWFVAKSLGADADQYKSKSHVFVFEDEYEWKDFLEKTLCPPWFGSFAHGDELFLSIRKMEGGGEFDSHTLAHETTHAIVARLYPGEHWPVWLNEGFAEYMGGASVAARKGQPIKSYQQNLKSADMPLEELFSLESYPDDRIKVAQLYQTGEKFVRFLMNDLPKDRFRRFAEASLKSKNPEEAFLQVYGDKFKDFASFKTRFAIFSR